MADYTTTYGVDASAEIDVTCHLDGIKRITVQENYDSATPPSADLLQRGRLSASGQIKISKGTPAIFTSPGEGYQYGQKAGTVKASSGSITVQQIETSRI